MPDINSLTPLHHRRRRSSTSSVSTTATNISTAATAGSTHGGDTLSPRPTNPMSLHYIAPSSSASSDEKVFEQQPQAPPPPPPDGHARLTRISLAHLRDECPRPGLQRRDSSATAFSGNTAAATQGSVSARTRTNSISSVATEGVVGERGELLGEVVQARRELERVRGENWELERRVRELEGELRRRGEEEECEGGGRGM